MENYLIYIDKDMLVTKLLKVAPVFLNRILYFPQWVLSIASSITAKSNLFYQLKRFASVISLKNNGFYVLVILK